MSSFAVTNMRIHQLFIFLVLLATLAACNGEQKKLKQKIAQVEAKTDKTNIESATALAQLYVEYVQKFGDDEEAPKYLFKAAELYQNTGAYAVSIELFEQFATEYPKNDNAGDALFSIGFIYEKMLGDYVQAKKAYEKFLEKYPNHAMAKDTRENLPYIGGLPDWAKDLENSTNQTTPIVADSLEEVN